jgi:hypothetical protein
VEFFEIPQGQSLPDDFRGNKLNPGQPEFPVPPFQHHLLRDAHPPVNLNHLIHNPKGGFGGV